MHEHITSASIKRFTQGAWNELSDAVAIEEPLEMRISFGPETQRQVKPLSITMRTPGDDADLVSGFLFTEGIISHSKDILSLRHQDFRKNVMLAELDPALDIDMQRMERHFYTSSSCGVCGKSSIDALITTNALKPSLGTAQIISPEVIAKLPQTLRKAQSGFEATGGLHASAIFDESGNLIALREDVGRHNALDKLIGHFFQANQLPLDQAILLLSGRISFELVQKSAMAGIKHICAIGAPSSLAIETAQTFGIRLIGFLREDKFNQYC